MIQIPHWLYEIYIYTGFILSLVFLGVIMYFRLNPYSSKIFFSYSHKDTELAKIIMDYLNTHHFKIWIDFELEIPESRIEKVLKGNVIKRDVFILLGSVNSTKSKWVQFELAEACEKSPLSYSKWKNIFILALDDYGIQLYQTLFEAFSEKHLQTQIFLDNVSIESTSKYEEWDTDINRDAFMGIPKNFTAEKLFLKVFGKNFAKLASFARLFLPTVTLVDLRKSFDFPMNQLQSDLRASTERYIPGSGSKPYKKVLLIPIIIWTIVAACYGLIIIVDLLSH